MGDTAPRVDAHEDSIAVMLPIPADVAAQFPDMGDSGEPHVTMVYVGGADETAVDTIKDIVADEASAIIGETLALGAPDYFDGPKGRAVFARVTVPEVVRAARDRIAKRIADAGIDVGHIPMDARMDDVTDHGPWYPHATLAYLAPGEEFDGETPTGEWTIDNVQVWHGDARHNIGGPERSDKISNVDGKWQVLTEDGAKVLGEFDSEDDARERLRQIEAAKAATHDRDVSDAITEDTVKLWLAEHISDARKMPRDRMAKLKALESEFPYLASPDVTTVYRGVRNVSRSAAGRMTGQSDPVRDKSWTTDLATAAKFASAVWSSDAPDPDRVGVVLVADADPTQLLLNHELLADLPGVADRYHDRWGETLSQAIKDEREVLALGPLDIRLVKVVAMDDFSDGSAELAIVQDAASPVDRVDQAQIELFRPMVAGLVGEILGRAPAVHTESRNCEWVMRSDQATVLTPDIKDIGGDWRQDDGLLPQETLINGWRRYPILYSKAGNVQTYPWGREWRDPRAVFDRASMDTGVGIPWELRHSPELLTPDTVRGVARGVVMTVDKHSDGIHTAGHAIAWDRGLWTAIDTDAPEVSIANRVKIDPRPGTTDDGKEFDARQVGFIMNSLASEPKGNAGTARVLTADDRLDAAHVVHRADDLLQIGRGLGRDPTCAPVYYDLRGWVRHDSATHRSDMDEDEELGEMTTQEREDATAFGDLLKKLAAERGVTNEQLGNAAGISASTVGQIKSGSIRVPPENRIKGLARVLGTSVGRLMGKLPEEERKDKNSMNDIIKALLEALTPAEIAEKLKMDEADVVAALAEPVADADAPPAAAGDEEKPPEDAPPREDADTVPIMVEGREFMVDPAVSAAFALLAEKVSINGDRADRLEIDLKAAKTEVKDRTDAAGDMIPRADAVQMAVAEALETGALIALAQSVNGLDSDGNAWTPEPRQDAEGTSIPVTVQDWAYGALTGAYGDKAPKIIERLDAASDTERPGLIKMRLEDAREIIADRADRSTSAVDAVNRVRETHASRRKDAAQPGPLAQAKAAQAKAGLNYKGATPTQNGAS